MKSKYMWPCALLVVSLCFALCACSTEFVPQETNDGFATNNTLYTNPEETVTGFVPRLSMRTYEEYLVFIETGKNPNSPFAPVDQDYNDEIPEDFVYYADVSTLGSFDALIMTSAYDFSEYVYSLNDPYVGKFLLYIDHEPDDQIQRPQISEVNLNDLRKIDATETCRFCLGDLIYTYVEGTLISVKWIAGNVEYKVYSDCFEEARLDADTAISKLLKAETAEAVAAAIVEKVEKS
ncbi:MAG: hypothetical protein IJ448_01025 [Oscillospiraceae bacterium]|nr:hypothetical protein [Oscillospiraceae bacterium]